MIFFSDLLTYVFFFLIISQATDYEHRSYNIRSMLAPLLDSFYMQLPTEFTENIHNIISILSLLQRSFVKTEPATRNSLRRRMGTYSVKPEYGKIKARTVLTFLKQVSFRYSLVLYYCFSEDACH